MIRLSTPSERSYIDVRGSHVSTIPVRAQAGISPSLADVPLEVLPSIDLTTLADHGEIPLLMDGQEGPFPDLARQPPPVFGSVPGQDRPGQEPEDDVANPSDVTDETPDARSGRPKSARRSLRYLREPS